MKLKLVNPLLIGQFNTTYDVQNPLDGAVNFWNDFSSHVTNNMPSMRITLMNDKKELFHFRIREKMHGGAKSVNFTVKQEYHDIPKKTKDEFLNAIEQDTQLIQNQAENQSGGKIKNAPKKKDYKLSKPSSSSDSSSDSSSESSSDESNDGDLYDFSKYRRLSQPIIYYSYTPSLYKITRFFTPTFVLPLTPYIRTWIPNP